MIQSLEEYITRFEQISRQWVPGQSIDCVILGFEDQRLKVLLLQWKHEEVWSLPGGFIRLDEDMDEAAYRILSERTGLQSIFLDQFCTFGNKDRQQIKTVGKRLKKLHLDNPAMINWFKQRFITTGYFALVDINKTSPEPDFLSEKCEWRAVEDLPDLILDHGQIITKALAQLKIELNYLPISISLLPRKFTMLDLQKLYEAILQKKLERSNFQRKMLKLGIFIRMEKLLSGGAHKAPYLYRFDRTKYKAAVKNGIGFIA